jgi:RNA polymerase sigma factor (sigma-70 family)
MNDSSSDSITCWISALQNGEEEAAQRLWERYYPHLVDLARRRLGTSPRRSFDEEDVALSAFHSFCRRAAQQAFPRLNDRHNLWSLLVTITVRKVSMKQRHQLRLRRGGGKVRSESAFLADEASGGIRGLSEVVGSEPSPEFAAELADQFDHLLEQLGEPSLQRIAVAKMEGWSNLEIAEQMRITDRTVRRKLKVIATIWEQDGDS